MGGVRIKIPGDIIEPSPQFICPIRRLKGRTNYTTADADRSYCATNSDEGSQTEFNADGPVHGPHGFWELDPDIPSCHYRNRKVVFATCKNTCPGGEEYCPLHSSK